MKEIYVKIETKVPVTIFEDSKVKEKVDVYFKETEEKFKERYYEILKVLNMQRQKELSLEYITCLFEVYFYKYILNDAVKEALTNSKKRDVLKNVISLITKERVEKDIMGKCMIDAFSDAIRSIQTDSAAVTILKGSKILLLEKKFLGIEIFPTHKKDND